MDKMRRRALAAIAMVAGLLDAGGASAQAVKELRIGYQPSPIQDASIAMFETWGAKNGVKIVKVPNSYGVYVEKMTAALTSNSDQYDVIWHNDDWGQLWVATCSPPTRTITDSPPEPRCGTARFYRSMAVSRRFAAASTATFWSQS